MDYRTEFNKGMANLISKIHSFANEYWENVLINMAGGYKATIPFLTIIAQLNECSLYHIFEETDALMEVPRISFSIELFDWNKIGTVNPLRSLTLLVRFFTINTKKKFLSFMPRRML